MDKIILSDFDGTITTKDTLVEILDAFAETDWRAIERSIIKKEFGNRIGLKQEFGLCDPKKATKEQIEKLLNEQIDIDPCLKPFLEFCKMNNCEFIIISGGFSLCIDTILKKYGLQDLPYYANKLLFPHINHSLGHMLQNPSGTKDRYRLNIEYPYSNENCKECGNCKTMHLERYKNMGYYVIYIGDSTTDRCPAKYADLVFAKKQLSEYCFKENIKHIVYETFTDIQGYLSENIFITETANK